MLGITIVVAEDRVRVNKRKRFFIKRQLWSFPNESPSEHNDVITQSLQPPLPVPQPRRILPHHRTGHTQ